MERILRDLQGGDTMGDANSNGEYDCQWSREDFYATAQNKKAVTICMFFLFLGYTTMVLLRYKNGISHVSTKIFYA